MCGITGIFSRGGGVDPALLKKATAAIRHRGPNDEGYLLVGAVSGRCDLRSGEDSIPQAKSSSRSITEPTDEPIAVGLGWRRLSIIDLSPTGHQPISNEDGTIWLIYNGEVYNYIELRRELEAKGYRFRTKSDTEVIVHAYDAWGPDCLGRFNGMWGLAIWDAKRKQLFCARDRFGVKPFYYSSTGSTFAFASEIKALLVGSSFQRRANSRAVHDYLSYALLDHTEETFFAGIKQLPPSHYLLIDASGTLSVHRYYTLTAESNHGPYEETEGKRYAKEFGELLRDAVKLRMRTDVPLGSCLSGGLDSSTIVCLANTLMAESGVIDRKLIGDHQKTFTAVYDDPRFSERPYVDNVTGRTGAKAHFVTPDGERLWTELRQIIFHQDEPFISSSIYAQWNVMRLAAENGITVLLDGQGGDELLAGYPWHKSIYHAELFRRLRLAALHMELRGSAAIEGRSYSTLLGEMFKKMMGGIIPRYLVERALEPDTVMNREFSSRHVREWGLLGKSNTDLQHRLFEEETQLNLQQLLHYEDRNSMAFAIEARVPFIDYRVVEYGMRIPSAYKIRRGWSKYVLREATEGIIPPEIQWRRDKMGFVTPQSLWIQKLLPKIREVLTEGMLRSSAFVNAEAVKMKLGEGVPRISENLLWRILNLELWMQVFDVR